MFFNLSPPLTLPNKEALSTLPIEKDPFYGQCVCKYGKNRMPLYLFQHIPYKRIIWIV